MKVTVLEPAHAAQFLYGVKDQLKQARECLTTEDEKNFFDFCLNQMKISFAQSFQDLWALYDQTEFGTNRFGKFFVDFGATNGIDSNNSYLLERNNWKGIVAEPNPKWEKELVQNRTCSVDFRCVTDTDGDKIQFHCVKAADLSSMADFVNSDYNSGQRQNIEQIIEKETVTLKTLLDTHNAPSFIDFLSIDTEGSEFMILDRFFKTKHKYHIRQIAVEHNFTHMREQLHTLLTSNGYKRKFEVFSRWDDFYIKG